MTPTLPILYFLICGIPGLIMWFKMLGIMEEKGKVVNYLWTSLTHFIDFNKIIKEETDVEKRRKYQFLLWGQIMLIPIYLIGMFIIINKTL